MKKSPQYVYFRESLIQSILADIFSYGILLFSFWVNAEYIGSKLLAAALLLFFLMFVFAKAINKAQKFYSKEDLQEYVNNL